MSSQNPIIQTPTQAKGIDVVILDLLTHLNLSLLWLTHGMGKAYRLAKVEVGKSAIFLPEVYLGTDRHKYFSATPDNDKKGQCFFAVGDATVLNQRVGHYGHIEQPISIIFSANLKLIDSVLLVTEDFTESLIQDVRNALLRGLIGRAYQLTIDDIQRDFEDVYSEFDVPNDRGIAHLPMTYFRINCTVTFKENCTP